MNTTLTRFICAAVAALLAFSSTAAAKTVQATSYGDDLAGSLLTVHFSYFPPGSAVALEVGSSTVTILGDSSTDTGYFFNPDFSYEFTMVGESFTGLWTIKNTNADPFTEFFITKVKIDTRPSLGGVYPALFDDGSVPSTPLSLAGVPGVIPHGSSTGPAPSSAVESNQTWPPGLVNLGDMYGIETLIWTGSKGRLLGPGQTFVWNDDTDLVIPEPTSLSLLLLGLAAAGCYAWRRR